MLKKYLLATIVLLCFIPKLNAEEGYTELRYISETTKTSLSDDIEYTQHLSGMGVEFYHELFQEKVNLFNSDQGKTSIEKRLEKILEQEIEKGNENKIKKLKKRLLVARKRRKEKELEREDLMKIKTTAGIVLEAKTLAGNSMFSNSNEKNRVNKTSFEIGLRISW